MLRKGQLRLGSNLFHYGVIIVILGHFVGFLAPHWAIDWALSPVAHQLLAMVVGGIAGLVAIVGLTILLARRLGDPRIRLNSRKWDIAVALMLWLQLALGLLTVPLSAFHMDGALFETLTSYVKGIVTLDGGAAALMVDVPLDLQAAHPARLHALPGVALHAHDPHLERRRGALLSVPALSDRPHAADAGKGAGAVMTISVNGIEIAVEPGASERTCCRARAAPTARGCGWLLAAEAHDEAAVDEAIEALLAREVITPSPTEEECRRYYESHPREFQSGDLVHARHILFQVTPSVRVPEMRARAEQTLNDLLREPDRFDARCA